MNQRGEAILLCMLLLVALTGLLTLCGLELQRSFAHLQARTQLFLCVKETKGELHQHLKLMGRTNWAFKNITRAQLVMIFIPGLQGAAVSVDRLKKALKGVQIFSRFKYLTALTRLIQKGCPVDPQMLLTPFALNGVDFKRGLEGEAILRKEIWANYYLKKPYLLVLRVDASQLEAINPKIYYQAKEKEATLSSLLRLR